MTDISNVDIPVPNPEEKSTPLTRGDLKIMAHIVDLAAGSCWRKCPRGKTWNEWLEFQRYNIFGFWAPDPEEFQRTHPDPLPDDHGDCFMNCLSKYSIWHDYVRRKFNVDSKVMPRVVLRIDEKIEPYGLLHPKSWNTFRSYFTSKEFLPNHLQEKPISEEDVPLMPSEEAALRKKEEDLAMKEAVKEDMFAEHLRATGASNFDDEKLDDEMEALRETKLDQLWTKIRTKQAKEELQRAGK